MTASRQTLTRILVLVLLAAPLVVDAQQARVFRVGVVVGGGPSAAAADGLRDGLRELGLEDGKQVVLHVRDVKGDTKSAAAVTTNLELENVDLIFSMGTGVTLEAKRATKSVPIASRSLDPCSSGRMK